MKRFLLVLLVLFFITPKVWAAPAQVIIIRHGEKPPVGNELDAQGFERANALVGYFKTNPAVLQYGTPVAIYAMAPNGPNGSIRAIQTVTPLASALGLAIHQNLTRDDLQPVVSEIMNTAAYDGRMVLICWEHTVIPQMAQDFGLINGPTTWDDNAFDRTWILNFSGNQVSGFQNLPQKLLPGDSVN